MTLQPRLVIADCKIGLVVQQPEIKGREKIKNRNSRVDYSSSSSSSSCLINGLRRRLLSNRNKLLGGRRRCLYQV